MTPKEQAAMRQALGALENAPIEYDFHGNPMDVEFGQQLEKAITALREALAQPDHLANAGKVIEQQEPVAWVDAKEEGYEFYGISYLPVGKHYLYAAPVRTKDLTVDEKVALADRLNLNGRIVVIDAVIAAYKEKNK